MRTEIKVFPKQMEFIESTGKADEVLYGGAAGGGKSFGQLCDALVYAMQYPKSKQLILRRTLPELRMSLIRVSRQLYPKEVANFKETEKIWTFINESIVEFGYY